MKKLFGLAAAVALLAGIASAQVPGSSSSGSLAVGQGLTGALGTCNQTPVIVGSSTLSVQVCPIDYSANHTVLATEMGALLVATSGTFTFTLPAVGGAGFQTGQTICFMNGGSGTVTIASSSTLVGPVTLSPNGNVCATADGVAPQWTLVGETGLLGSITTLSSALSISGVTLDIAAGGVTSAKLASGAAATNVGTLGGDLTGTLPNAGVGKVNGDASVAFLDINQAFSKGQAVVPVALSYVSGGTTLVDFSLSNAFTVTLTNTTTQLGNPSNVRAGQCGQVYVLQDATGGRLMTFGSSWKFAGGIAPTLSVGSGALDVLSFCAKTSALVAGQMLLNVQ